MKIKFDVPVSELTRLIDEWIYSERDRQILKRKIIDGVTYEKLAEEFSLSTKQVNNIVIEGTKKLRTKL